MFQTINFQIHIKFGPFYSIFTTHSYLKGIRDACSRAIRPDLKCGICGEHGGEPSSVKFCHRVGLNYVSCSPFRVPIARLAAAQAAVEE